MADNLIIAPGFIDAHAHGNPLRDNHDKLRSFLRQGVTTVILGQDGSSPQRLDQTFTQWMEAVDTSGSAPNVAALIGHGDIRRRSGGGEKDKITPAEQTKMESLLSAAMDAGAYGLSTGLEYVPGRYADAAELSGLAKTVGAHGGLISSHIRSEDDDAVAASVAELIDLAPYAPVNVTHIKVVYGKTAAQGEAVLQQIRDARAQGMAVSADVYPYLASFGSMTFLYPPWAKRESEFNDAVANRREELEAFLRAKIKRRNGPSAILVSSGKYTGKTLAEISEITGTDPEDLIIEFEHGGPATAHFIMTKATQDVFITAPDVSISSDGSPTMRHPRSFGSFPKVLEDYVVRDKTLPLELAIHKMTGLTAQTFGIQSRGVLKPGYAADILLIDLENVKANTGWSDVNAVPSGIVTTIVNGNIASSEASAVTQSYTRNINPEGLPTYGRMLRKTNGD